MKAKILDSKTALIAMVLIIGLLRTSVCAVQAYAYQKTGQKWGSKTQTVYLDSSVKGAYLTGAKSAIVNYDNSTDAVMKQSTTQSKLPWKAAVKRVANSGWEGRSEWNYNKTTNKITSATSTINSYYCSGYSSAQLKVIWLHEFGHVWGLAHSVRKDRVMYTSASAAYKNGVRSLTSDEISGINALY